MDCGKAKPGNQGHDLYESQDRAKRPLYTTVHLVILPTNFKFKIEPWNDIDRQRSCFECSW